MADDLTSSVGPDGETPGARLRTAREATRQSTRDIARKLHVDTWILDAIERDEFGALGAPVFAKGHLRKYAVELGENPDDLMVGYYQIAGSGESPPLIAESILRMESASSPSFGWLLPAAIVVASVASVAAGAMWYLRSDAVPRPASAAVASPEVERASGDGRSAALALPAASGDGDGLAGPAAQQQDVVAQEPPAPQPAAPAPAVQVAAAATQAPPETVAASEPDVVPERPPDAAAADDGSVTLMLRFREDSWVEVYDRDRNKLLYGMGEGGSVRYISGPPPLGVFLGRYRAVDVEVNGNPYDIPRESRRTNTARFRVAP